MATTYSDTLNILRLYQDDYGYISDSHSGVMERNRRNITLMVGVNPNTYKKSRWVSGDLDEVRIVNEARSLDYLYTTFYSNNDTLNEFGTLDINPDAPPTLAPVSLFKANSTKINPGDTAQFVDLTIYDPTTWHWTFGDGGNSALQDPSHEYAAIGDYTVSLNTSNAVGFDVETKTDYINVRDAPTIVSVVISNTTPEVDVTTVSFSATTTGDDLIYRWDFDDDSDYDMSSSATHVFTTVGEYNTSFIIQNDYGADEVHTIITVRDHPGTEIGLFNLENISNIQAVMIIGVILIAVGIFIRVLAGLICGKD